MQELVSASLPIATDESDVEPEHDREKEIEVPFDPKKIDIQTTRITVDALLRRLKNKELDLSPDFQRQAHLWDNRRQSRLIESILLRIPLPSFYFSEDDSGNYAVVDGLQRLCTIFHFLDAKILNLATNAALSPLRLSDLQYLKELDAKLYIDMDRAFQRRVEELEISVNVIRAGTPSAVKFNVFARLNQGGLPLTAQEIRNAIFPGPWRRHIRDMATSETFIRVTQGRIRTDRQQDAELALRFVALARLGKPYERVSRVTLDEFLNNTVEQELSRWSERDWTGVETRFERALLGAEHIFGRYAFRKVYDPRASRLPINRGLFEAELLAIDSLADAEIEALAAMKEAVLAALSAKLQSEDSPGFASALSFATGSGEASNTRISTMMALLREVLDA
jgi:hypothetical protein